MSGGGWPSTRRVFLPLVILSALLFVVRSTPARGALITGNYGINYDQDIDKTDSGTTNVRKYKQTLELKYRGLLSPLVKNEVTFKGEHEINSNAPNVTRFLPTLDLGFKGGFWEGKLGAKQTQENSDDPAKNPKITTNYFGEFFFLAPGGIPDLKAKYTIDKDYEEGVTDKVDAGVVVSSVYKPNEWLNVKGEFEKRTSDDRFNDDSDTEEEKLSGTFGIRHFVSEKVKYDGEYDIEVVRGATLLDAGGATNTKEDYKHNLKNLLSVRPFENTDITGSYDYELKQDKVSGKHSRNRNSGLRFSQRIGVPFDLRGEFKRIAIEEKYSDDDYQSEETTWTAEFKAKFSKKLDFSFKYEKKGLEALHAISTNDEDSGSNLKSVTWTGDMAPFWKASASFEVLDDIENKAKIMIDTKYSLKSTFDFKAINLSLAPTYDITFKEDLKIPEKTETRDFRFGIAWKVFTTATMEGKVDHTYGRKIDSGAENIQRSDTTTANFAWNQPVPNTILGVDVSRTATDTSGDDVPPDITTAFGFKADYKVDWFTVSTSYKYDKKSISDDAETFDAKIGWLAPKWDVSLTYSYTKTYSVALDVGYTIGLAFKYNL